jgi:hypothetical protein
LQGRLLFILPNVIPTIFLKSKYHNPILQVLKQGTEGAMGYHNNL